LLRSNHIVAKVIGIAFSSPYFACLVLRAKHELQNLNQEQTSFEESVRDYVENSHFISA
jgi:membrane-anchored protein YejM (alkaline phosphatase superfamily)